MPHSDDSSSRITLRAAADGPALAIHGGAGARPGLLQEDEKAAYHQELEAAVQAGRSVLDRGGAALDAVCESVLVLENAPHFNAAHGAALNAHGEAELDAAVMTGDGSAGAVAGVRTARNPVLAARAVMEHTPHVMIMAPDGRQLAEWGIETVDPEYFITDHRRVQLAELQSVQLTGPRHGTVGAVARDAKGRLAAATSTGGTANQAPGRVGDSPIIGAGTWASNETAAISCTGVGEDFMRQVVAHAIDARMRYRNDDLDLAVAEAMATLGAAGGRGGLIAISRSGEVVLTYNTEGMFSGWYENGKVHTHV